MPGHPINIVTPPSHVMPAKIPGQGDRTTRYRNAGNQASEKRKTGAPSGPIKGTSSNVGARSFRLTRGA